MLKTKLYYTHMRIANTLPLQAKKQAKKDQEKLKAAEKKEKDNAKKKAEKQAAKDAQAVKKHNNSVNTLATKFISVFEPIHVSLLQASSFITSRPDNFPETLKTDVNEQLTWVTEKLQEAKIVQKETAKHLKKGNESTSRVDDLSFDIDAIRTEGVKVKNTLKQYSTAAKAAV